MGTYITTRTLTGKVIVKFRCPNCVEPLRNPIELAGRTERCPQCDHPFTVPGRPELEKLQKQKADKEEAKQLREQKAAAARAQRKLDLEKQEAEQKAAAVRRADEMFAAEQRYKLEVEARRVEEERIANDPNEANRRIEDLLEQTRKMLEAREKRQVAAGIMLIVVAIGFNYLAFLHNSAYRPDEFGEAVLLSAGGILFWIGVAKLISR